MSKGRLISSYVLTAAVVLAAAWFATASFPLEATPLVEAQQSTTSQGVVRVELAPNLPEPLRSNLRARLAGFQGRPYTLEMRAEILKAAREVDPTAIILSVSQSESADGLLVATFVVAASQGESPPPPPSAPPGVAVRKVAPTTTTPQGPVHIDVSQLSEPLRSTTQVRLAPFEGQQYTPDLRNLVTKALTEVDPQARWVLAAPRQTGDGSVTLTILALGDRVDLRIAPYPAPAEFPPSSAKRTSVTGDVQAAKLIQSSPPEYPPLARQARIQGTVRFTAVIGVDGRVANITLISGHPLLVPPAQAVARDYVYKPTLLNGEPVEVVTQIDVNFSLQ